MARKTANPRRRRASKSLQTSAARAQAEEVPEQRPSAPSLRSLARKHAASAVDALAAVMSDGSATPAARVSAAGALLAWGYGKANQGEETAKSRKGAEQIIRLVWGGDDA